VASSLLGLGANWLRPNGVSLAHYAAANACSAPHAAAEPTTLVPQEVASLCSRGGTLIADVRSAEAYLHGHVAGAIHLPCSAPGRDADHLLRLLDGKTTLVVYGETTGEAARVAQNLVQRSANPSLAVVVVDGGWAAWQAANLACASGPCEECESQASHAKSQ